MSKTNKIALVGLFVMLFVVYLVYSTIQHHKSVLYEQVAVNKDTGQTIIKTPNQTPENGSGSTQITALGTNKFLTAGMTQAQFTLTTQLLTAYVHQLPNSKYQQVAILNNGFKSTGNDIYAHMRLGDSSNLLDLNINYYDLTVVDLRVSDPSGNKAYSYDSGPQSTPQSTDSGTSD